MALGDFNIREEYLFQKMDFVAHSGKKLTWKIECDAIQSSEWVTIAHIINELEKRPFGEVVGIPRGGVTLGNILQGYATGKDEDPLLIVDDVMTTGGSFKYFAEQYFRNRPYRKFFGWCVFNRGSDDAPAWVTSLFTMPYYSEEYGLVKNGIGDGKTPNQRWSNSEERIRQMEKEDEDYWNRVWKKKERF